MTTEPGVTERLYQPLPSPTHAERARAAAASSSAARSTFDVSAGEISGDMVAGSQHEDTAPTRTWGSMLPTLESLSRHLPTKASAAQRLRSYRTALANMSLKKGLTAFGILALAAQGGHNVWVDSRLARAVYLPPARGRNDIAGRCADIAGNDGVQSGDYNRQRANFDRASGLCSPAGEHFARKMAKIYAAMAEEEAESAALNCTAHGVVAESVHHADYPQYEKNSIMWEEKIKNRTLSADERAQTHARLKDAYTPGLLREARVFNGIEAAFNDMKNTSATFAPDETFIPSDEATKHLVEDKADSARQLAFFDLKAPDPKECAEPMQLPSLAIAG